MALESLAGQLNIKIIHDGTSVKDLKIDSTRPLNMHQVLEGRPVKEVLKLVPMIYSLCGDAQKVAAIHAIEQAIGLQVDPSVEQARSIMIAAEAGRELLLRLIRLGHLSDIIPATTVMRWHISVQEMYSHTMEPGIDSSLRVDLESFRSSYLNLIAPLCSSSTELIAGNSHIDADLDTGEGPLTAIHQYLGECFSHLPVASGSPVLVSTMPELIEALAAGVDFCEAPQLNGQCYETGVWAKYCDSHEIIAAQRRGEHGVQLRFRALLAAIQDLPGWAERMDNLLTKGLGKPVEKGEGFGAVMASRGILIHRIQLSEASINAKVNQYQIVAPTEWNFHSGGTLTQMLKGARVGVKSVVELTRTLVKAIDPCVECQVELVYA